jgi:hypothetical protein
MVHGVLFATLHSLRKIQMGIISECVCVSGKPFQPSAMLHYDLLGTFINYKENEVLCQLTALLVGEVAGYQRPICV